MKRHRNFYKILSIAIAVFLWLYVFIEVSPMTTSTFRDVKVQMENENILESRGLAILSVQPENIDVNVEGKRGNFFQLKHTDILATLDCAELHEGINVVPVRVVLPDSYKVASKKPAKISVRVEKKLIQKKNTVIKFKQTLGGNKEIGKIEMSHRQMKVTGPKSMLSRVHHIEVPVSDADIMRSNGSIKVKPIPVSRSGEKIDRVKILGGKVTVNASVLTLKSVPFEVKVTGQAAKGYRISDVVMPRNIYIKGDEKALEEIDIIKADTISIEGVTSDGKVRVKPNMPRGVELSVKNSRIFVSYKVNEIQKRKFSFKADEIQIVGGEYIRIVTPEVEVILYGDNNVLDNITKESLQPYIEIDENAARDHRATVKLKSVGDGITYDTRPMTIVYEEIKE